MKPECWKLPQPQPENDEQLQNSSQHSAQIEVDGVDQKRERKKQNAILAFYFNDFVRNMAPEHVISYPQVWSCGKPEIPICTITNICVFLSSVYSAQCTFMLLLLYVYGKLHFSMNKLYSDLSVSNYSRSTSQ